MYIPRFCHIVSEYWMLPLQTAHLMDNHGQWKMMQWVTSPIEICLMSSKIVTRSLSFCTTLYCFVQGDPPGPNTSQIGTDLYYKKCLVCAVWVDHVSLKDRPNVMQSHPLHGNISSKSRPHQLWWDACWDDQEIGTGNLIPSRNEKGGMEPKKKTRGLFHANKADWWLTIFWGDWNVLGDKLGVDCLWLKCFRWLTRGGLLVIEMF